MNDQENHTVTGPLLEQIDRQSEIIAYLLTKNERLRSRLRDLEEQPCEIGGRQTPRCPGDSTAVPVTSGPGRRGMSGERWRFGIAHHDSVPSFAKRMDARIISRVICSLAAWPASRTITSLALFHCRLSFQALAIGD